MASHGQGLLSPALLQKQFDVQAHEGLTRCHERFPSLMEWDLETLLVEQGLGFEKGFQSRGPIPQCFLRLRLSESGPQPAVGGARR